ncbi:hypothetical protein C1645_788552, partial [Glomus cerebriforme]
MFICVSSNLVFSIGLFPFSFIFISNLYSYTLFLTNSISLFLGPLVPSGSAIKVSCFSLYISFLTLFFTIFISFFLDLLVLSVLQLIKVCFLFFIYFFFYCFYLIYISLL